MREKKPKNQDNPFTGAIKPRDGRARKLPKKITQQYLHNSGLYYLQRFAASSSHFRAVMLRKVKRSCHARPEQDFEACKAMVEELVQTFERAGLLNDDAYLKGMVQSLRRRGLSRQAILMRLKAKGFGTDTVDASLRDCDAEKTGSMHDAELIAALKHARKKRLGPYQGMKIKDDEKAMATFARQGFKYETARIVLKMNRHDADEILIGA